MLSAEQGWPRVNVRCDYRAPLVFGDLVTVELTVEELKSSSVVWGFRVIKDKEALVAEGSVTTVLVSGEGKPLEICAQDRESLLGE